MKKRLGAPASSPAFVQEPTGTSALQGLVPKLRFPEFRGTALRSVQLGDVTEEGRIRNGKKHSVASVMGVSKVDGIVPMEARVIAADIERYRIVEHDWFAYNPMRLNIGSIARWKGNREILVSPDYVVFKCIRDDESGLLPGYFDQFRQTNAWEDFVTEGGDGGVRVRIYYKDVARLHLVLPSLAEQQRIAECLSTLDELIGATSQKLDALKAHKKGLMQQLFPREGETLPRLRFPEFQNKAEWTIKKIGDFADVAAAGDLDDALYSETETNKHRYPVFSNGVTDEGLYGYYSMGKYPSDSVTITARGTLGVAFFRPHDFMGIGRLVILSNFIEAEPTFIRSCWNLLAKIPHEVTSIPQLTAITVRATLLPLPELKEQHRIASCLSSLDDLIAAQSNKLEALKTHKKGLMQQLFPSPLEAEA